MIFKLFHNYSIIPFLFQSKKLFQNTPKWNRDYSIWRPQALIQNDRVPYMLNGYLQ
jgi:hypothetical protein